MHTSAAVPVAEPPLVVRTPPGRPHFSDRTRGSVHIAWDLAASDAVSDTTKKNDGRRNMKPTYVRLASIVLLFGGLMVRPAVSQRVTKDIPVTDAVTRWSSLHETRLSQQEGAAGQSTPALNLAGTYRCGPDTKACQWLGTTITVTQSGTKLEIKSEKGDTAIGELMGNVGATAGPPMNMIAAISADGRTLDWSNGTKWTKQ